MWLKAHMDLKDVLETTFYDPIIMSIPLAWWCHQNNFFCLFGWWLPLFNESLSNKQVRLISTGFKMTVLTPKSGIKNSQKKNSQKRTKFSCYFTLPSFFFSGRKSFWTSFMLHIKVTWSVHMILRSHDIKVIASY